MSKIPSHIFTGIAIVTLSDIDAELDALVSHVGLRQAAKELIERNASLTTFEPFASQGRLDHRIEALSCRLILRCLES